MFDYLHAKRIKGTGPFDNRSVFGIPLSRFGGSWLTVGCSADDMDGFYEWMEQIKFYGRDGTYSYITDVDPVAIPDAYELMTCGKCELECDLREFLASRK